MPTPIDPKRLPGLEEALKQYGDEDRLSQQQLADVYGVSNARLTTLIKNRFPDFPSAERHDDKTHWFPARAAIASMIAYMTNTSAAKKAQARRHSAVMSGVTVAREDAAVAAAEEPEPLSAAELDRLASARTRVWKLQKEQGMYVARAEVVETMRGANALLTREIMNLPTSMDPNGELPRDQRAQLERRCREMLMRLNEKLGAFLDGDDDVDRTPAVAGSRGGDRGALRRRPLPKRQGSVGSAA